MDHDKASKLMVLGRAILRNVLNHSPQHVLWSYYTVSGSVQVDWQDVVLDAIDHLYGMKEIRMTHVLEMIC